MLAIIGYKFLIVSDKINLTIIMLFAIMIAGIVNKKRPFTAVYC
jgi:hypothetical protein